MNALILYILLISLGVIFPKSKLVFYLQWLFLTVAIAFNRGGPDVDAYHAMYSINGSLETFSIKTEILYQYLSYLSYQSGLGFDEFTMLTSILAMLVLGYSISRIATLIALVMSLILIFPGIDFIIQKRNFLGICSLFLGFSFLIRNVKYAKIKYSFCVLVASGFHSLFILYMIFPFIPRKIFKCFEQYSLFFVTGLFLFSPFIPKLAILVMSSTKFNLYFDNAELFLSWYKALFFVFVQLAFVFFSLRILRLYYIESDIVFLGKNLFYFSLIALPFYFYGSTFIRIYKNLLPIFYVFIFYSGYRLFDVFCLRINRNYLGVCILVLIQAFVAYGLGAGWNIVVQPLFEQNVVFELINF